VATPHDFNNDGGNLQNRYQITVQLGTSAPTIDLGTWDTLTGGEADSDEFKYRPGGLSGASVSLGGAQLVNNVTVGKIFDDTIAGLVDELLKARGSRNVQITKQALDRNWAVFGKSTIVYVGKLKMVTLPDADSNATGTEAIITLEVSSASVTASMHS
jgi:hypothetical protein